MQNRHGPIRISEAQVVNRDSGFKLSFEGAGHGQTVRSPEEIRGASVRPHEQQLVEALSANYRECDAVSAGGCACTGECLGAQLAALRAITDRAYDLPRDDTWWSDQGHTRLVRRPHDTGTPCQPLTSNNYFGDA